MWRKPLAIFRQKKTNAGFSVRIIVTHEVDISITISHSNWKPKNLLEMRSLAKMPVLMLI